MQEFGHELSGIFGARKSPWETGIELAGIRELFACYFGRGKCDPTFSNNPNLKGWEKHKNSKKIYRLASSASVVLFGSTCSVFI